MHKKAQSISGEFFKEITCTFSLYLFNYLVLIAVTANIPLVPKVMLKDRLALFFVNSNCENIQEIHTLNPDAKVILNNLHAVF